MKSVQAQRVIAALKSIGLTHGTLQNGGDFHVETEMERIRGGEERLHSQFGDAVAHIEKDVANELAAERAEDLVRRGLSVVIVCVVVRQIVWFAEGTPTGWARREAAMRWWHFHRHLSRKIRSIISMYHVGNGPLLQR